MHLLQVAAYVLERKANLPLEWGLAIEIVEREPELCHNDHKWLHPLMVELLFPPFTRANAVVSSLRRDQDELLRQRQPTVVSLLTQDRSVLPPDFKKRPPTGKKRLRTKPEKKIAAYRARQRTEEKEKKKAKRARSARRAVDALSESGPKLRKEYVLGFEVMGLSRYGASVHLLQRLGAALARGLDGPAPAAVMARLRVTLQEYACAYMSPVYRGPLDEQHADAMEALLVLFNALEAAAFGVHGAECGMLLSDFYYEHVELQECAACGSLVGLRDTSVLLSLALHPGLADDDDASGGAGNGLEREDEKRAKNTASEKAEKHVQDQQQQQQQHQQQQQQHDEGADVDSDERGRAGGALRGEGGLSVQSLVEHLYTRPTPGPPARRAVPHLDRRGACDEPCSVNETYDASESKFRTHKVFSPAPRALIVSINHHAAVNQVASVRVGIDAELRLPCVTYAMPAIVQERGEDGQPRRNVVDDAYAFQQSVVLVRYDLVMVALYRQHGVDGNHGHYVAAHVTGHDAAGGLLLSVVDDDKVTTRELKLADIGSEGLVPFAVYHRRVDQASPLAAVPRIQLPLFVRGRGTHCFLSVAVHALFAATGITPEQLLRLSTAVLRLHGPTSGGSSGASATKKAVPAADVIGDGHEAESELDEDGDYRWMVRGGQRHVHAFQNKFLHWQHATAQFAAMFTTAVSDDELDSWLREKRFDEPAALLTQRALESSLVLLVSRFLQNELGDPSQQQLPKGDPFARQRTISVALFSESTATVGQSAVPMWQAALLGTFAPYARSVVFTENVGGAHWGVFIVDRGRRISDKVEAYYVDSFGGVSGAGIAANVWLRRARAGASRGVAGLPEVVKAVFAARVQKDSVNCGFFALMALYAFFRRRFRLDRRGAALEHDAMPFNETAVLIDAVVAVSGEAPSRAALAAQLQLIDGDDGDVKTALWSSIISDFRARMCGVWRTLDALRREQRAPRRVVVLDECVQRWFRMPLPVRKESIRKKRKKRRKMRQTTSAQRGDHEDNGDAEVKDEEAEATGKKAVDKRKVADGAKKGVPKLRRSSRNRR